MLYEINGTQYAVRLSRFLRNKTRKARTQTRPGNDMVNTNTNIPDPTLTLTLPGCPPDNHNKDINLRNFRCFPKSKKFEEFFYKRIARYLGGTYETITNTAITNNASSSVSNSIDSDSDLSLSLEESVGIDYDHSSIWLNQNVALMLVISLGKLQLLIIESIFLYELVSVFCLDYSDDFLCFSIKT